MDFTLIIDGMSIKKETKWDPKHQKFIGTVDYGKIKAEDPYNIATNVLVILIGSLKKPLSIPLGYFLTHKLNSDVLCQLIKESIKMLHEVGAHVHAVIFDGASKNVGMIEKLGCNIKNLDGSFPHPCHHDRRVHVFFDICHMIKLAGNTFSDLKIFCTPFNEKISWQHILLYQTQQKDILHLGNKLKSQHVKWQNHKMKVKFATQLFSHSVSAAITSNIWCADVLHYISGFVAKKFWNQLTVQNVLQHCTKIQIHHFLMSIQVQSLLTCNKYGNLLLPSYSVYKVVTCLDKLARRSLCKWSSSNKQDKLAIAMFVFKETRNTTFLSIQITPRRLISVIII